MKNFVSTCLMPLIIVFLFISAGCDSDVPQQSGLENVSADQSSYFVGTGSDPLVVKTKYGTIKGQYDGETLVWKKIPFAKPPVGDLRWKEPKDPGSWNGVREETEFCDICPQYLTDPTNISKTTGISGSEDCLYLNVWRPDTKESNLPVYFWIHGGGNSIQLPMHKDLSGANLAENNNFVVVSINYRLGPLGWLTHPALRDGTKNDNSGNYGTLDIIKALKWVKNNIKAFGGNPGNVTVAGESAGGMNIFSLIISEEAKGLFHRGIIESGMTTISTVGQGETYANGLIIKLLIKDGLASDETSAQAYLDKMSNSQIRTYLRSESAEKLVGLNTPASGAMYLIPNVFPDGAVIPKSGYVTLYNGTYPNKVPLIIGTNKDEVKLFFFMTPRFAPIVMGTADAELVELYTLVCKYMSDMWKAGIDTTVRAMRTYQKNIYMYQFAWGSGDEASVIPYPFNIALGSCHGMEIEFFFGNTDNVTGMLGKVAYTAQNQTGRTALSDAIMSYVDGFARKGDPNAYAEDLPEWKPWSNYLLYAPKSIILDAGYTDLKIKMSQEEYNAAVIMGQLLLEPRASEILEVLNELSGLLI